MGRIADAVNVLLGREANLARPGSRPERDPIRVPPMLDADLALCDSTTMSQEQGLFRLPAQMANVMDRDDRIWSCLNTRQLAVEGLDQTWQDSPNGPGLKRARSALERDFPVIFNKSLQGEVIRKLTVHGYAVGRLNHWTTAPIPTLNIWDPYFLRYDFDRNCFMAQCVWVNERGTQITGEQAVIPGDGNWVLWTGRNHSKPYMGGGIRVLPRLAVLRGSNMLDWARHGKGWGNPPKVVETTSLPAAKVKDYEMLAARLLELVGDSVITLPAGAKISLLELKRDAWRVFQAYGPEFLDDCIAIVILGQNLTTKIKGASLAAAKAHNFVRLDYLRGDTRNLRDTSLAQICYPYYAYRFGIQDPLDVPIPDWPVEEKADNKTLAEEAKAQGEAYSALARGMRDLKSIGVKADRQEVCKKNGIPVEKFEEWAESQPDPESPIVPPQPAAPPSP